MPKVVHVIFKTHLDVGFTGMGVDVLANYRDSFIPKAIALAEEARNDPRDIEFVWTTGSWLIHHAFEAGTAEQVAALDAAIRRGDIAWHALPLSTHSELMDPELFDYGISVSEALDHKYGRSTKAGKMTDVPGHTVGIVPLLARRGIGYLHIGVNPASALPAVPSAFVWRAPDGSEVLVNYDASYGAAELGRALEIEGCDSALYISHTNDNLGPPDLEAVAELFELLRKNYPEAEVRASTFEEFAATTYEVKDQLPVLTDEIGDTWIHGPASDPLQVARYRELLRCQRGWLADGRLVRGSAEHAGFNDPLLLIAEHTWGEDEKSFLPDYTNYGREEFANARARDVVDPEQIPEEYPFLREWVARPPDDGFSYSGYEASWAEQRGYVERAIAALPDHLQAEARLAVSRFDRAPDAVATSAADAGATHKLGQFEVRFGADGAISSLVDQDGREWAGHGNPIGSYWHETFGAEDYQRWYDGYCRDLDLNESWALADFGKLGFQHAVPAPARERRVPQLASFGVASLPDGDLVELSLDLPEEATSGYGAPREIVLRYRFDRAEPKIEIELRLAGRTAARLPEASWFTINPVVADSSRWSMSKLGTELSPLAVVANGNRNLHAVEELNYRDDVSRVRIQPVDAPVVAFGAPRILEFDNQFPDLDGGFHLNLHNNVWGTNFRMWFDDDMTYRVHLRLDQA